MNPSSSNNLFGNDFDQEPCLHFMQDQSNNSLMGNIIINEQLNRDDRLCNNFGGEDGCRSNYQNQNDLLQHNCPSPLLLRQYSYGDRLGIQPQSNQQQLRMLDSSSQLQYMHQKRQKMQPNNNLDRMEQQQQQNNLPSQCQQTAGANYNNSNGRKKLQQSSSFYIQKKNNNLETTKIKISQQQGWQMMQPKKLKKSQQQSQDIKLQQSQQPNLIHNRYRQPEPKTSLQSNLRTQPLTHSQSQQSIPPASLSMKKKRVPANKSKEKKKIFYRDKMAELINEESYIKPEYNYMADFGGLSRDGYDQDRVPISRDQQLKRNRESAKQSRQRKKEYVETLEDKNKEHLKTISDLNQRLRQKQLELQRLKQRTKSLLKKDQRRQGVDIMGQSASSYDDLMSEMYEKLEKTLIQYKERKASSSNLQKNQNSMQQERPVSQLSSPQSQSPSQNSSSMFSLRNDIISNPNMNNLNYCSKHSSESALHLTGSSHNRQQFKDIQRILAEHKANFGSCGKERIRIMNYFMQEIIENSLPDIHKYIINCAWEGRGMFKEKGKNGAKSSELNNQSSPVLGKSINGESFVVGDSRIQSQINQIIWKNTDAAKRSAIIQRYRDNIKKQAKIFREISQKFYQGFNSLINQSSIIERICQDMRANFNPAQVAQLFLYFQENKFRKDHKRIKNEWYEGFLKQRQKNAPTEMCWENISKGQTSKVTRISSSSHMRSQQDVQEGDCIRKIAKKQRNYG